MRAIQRGLVGENSDTLRGLTGQGEPGLWTLLGGTSIEPDAGGRRLAGGAGQVSNAARLNRHVAGVASGLGGNVRGGAPADPIRIRNPRDPRPEQ